MKSKLHETKNLLSLFVHQVGESETPKNYYVWAFVSLLAALVGKRVWVLKGNRPLYPNLYVALIGPSAIGKGQAINEALYLVTEHESLKLRLNMFNGEITRQKMAMRLAGNGKAVPPGGVSPGEFYLVTPELAHSLGSGESASAFIKWMTMIYDRHQVPVSKDTVGAGEYMLKDHCVSWIAGTTESWMMQCISPDDVSGGFMGRMVAVHEGYDKIHRYPNPRRPPDCTEIVAYLQERLLKIAWTEGQFEKTADAVMIEEGWYMKRPWPSDEALVPAFKRAHDLSLKLAMLIALFDSEDLKIEAHHMQRAQNWADQILKLMPGIIKYAHASTTFENRAYQWTADFIKQYKKVTRSTLVKEFSGRGHGNAEGLDKVMRTLQEAKLVEYTPQGQTRWYSWIGSKKMSLNGHHPSQEVEE